MTSRTCDTWDTSRPRLSRHASVRRRRRRRRGTTTAAAATTTTTAPSVDGGGGGRGSEAGANAAAAFASFHPPSRRRSLAQRPGSSSLGSSTAPATTLDGDLRFRGGGGETEEEGKGADRRSPPRPVPNVDEPNLFDIPPDLHPTYRQIPAPLRVVLASVSALLVAERRRRRRLSFSPSSMFGTTRLLSTTIVTATTSITAWRALREFVFFLLRTALLWKISELVVQERFLSPSRVTTSCLAEGGRLPSALSRYAIVTPVSVSRTGKEEEEEEEEENVLPIGVHYLLYSRRRTTTTTTTTTTNNTTTSNSGSSGTIGGEGAARRRYDGISLHHGFGASSLSWLPVLPSLVERLGRREEDDEDDDDGRRRRRIRPSVGVAHDAPGFGFTDRPDGNVDGGLERYGSENSAGIGLALLAESLDRDDSDDGIGTARSVAVFGHSMGTRAALSMALRCASDPGLMIRPDLVVLVAPALEGVTLPPSRRRRAARSYVARSGEARWIDRTRGLAKRVWVAWRRIFVDRPLRYGLRRLVCGSRDFWRKGLTFAWGDPNRLSDGDVLRFQWPSVGKGWEEGLINFSRSRVLLSPPPNALDDGQLFRKVARLRDTRMVVMYGSKDRVVRIDDGAAEAIRREFPNVAVIKMEGCGHDPFEEDVPGFLMALEKALEGGE